MTVRRLKTYTGQTGYVYQYYFVGRREALSSDAEAPATEYVFDVTPDRKFVYSVSVLLRDDALNHWATAHGRSLAHAEQYAAAKMRLLRAFDEIENMFERGRRLPIGPGELNDLLSPLGVE